MIFESLPIAALQESPLNPRKHFDPVKLQELAESFHGAGIIEPLVVRPNGKAGTYEVVAGARRLRAAKLAQLAEVPAIVRDLTDAQVLEIMVVENNQRDDVNPLEEGDGFARLLKLGYDLEKLAERIGRSKKYIYDRIKLLDLVPEAKQLVLDEKVTAGHAILLARLKPQDQQRVLDPDRRALFEADMGASDDEVDARMSDEDRFAGMKPRSVRELRTYITEHVRFDVQHAAQAAPLDFGDVAEQVQEAEAKPGRGKKVIAITFAGYVQPDAKGEDGVRIYGPRSFEVAEGRPCAHQVLGIVVVGRECYGEAVPVCIARDKCEVHWKAEIAAKRKTEQARAAGKPDAARQREAAADERRRQEYEERQWKEAAERQKFAAAAPALAKAFAARFMKRKLADLVADVRDSFDGVPATVKLLGPPKTAEDWLRVFALSRVLRVLTWEWRAPAEVPPLAKRYGVDLKAVFTGLRVREKQVLKENWDRRRGKAVQTSARKKKR